MAKLYHIVTAGKSPAVGDDGEGNCGHSFEAVALSTRTPPRGQMCPGCNCTKDDLVPRGQDVFYVAEEVEFLPGETRNPMGLISRMMAEAKVHIAKLGSEVPTDQEAVLEKAKQIRAERKETKPRKPKGTLLQLRPPDKSKQ